MSATRQEGRGVGTVESEKFPQRILLVLRAVQRGGGTMRLTDVAREAQLPLSTAHRMLAQLGAQDLVAKSGGRYRLGTAMKELAKPVEVNRRALLRRALKPLLVGVHEKTRYVVGLANAGRRNVEFIDIAYRWQYCAVIPRIEEETPLGVSAAGKVLLAYDSALAGDVAQRAGEADRPLHVALRTELPEIRRRGVAHSCCDEATGISAVAAPIFGDDRRPVAALSIGAYRDQFDVLAASGFVRQAAAYARTVLQRYAAA